MKFSPVEKLTLPDDAITQTFGFFGRKGSGKTYAAGVLVESFLASGTQVVVIDPVGNWYGLRLKSDGKSPSRFAIPILGGSRGDIPLQTTGGALVAQTVIETGTSAVLDVSLFRKAERKRFMADFAEELFHRKKVNRSPMHLVIEEAQLFAPQMAKGEERMLGAIEDLVRLGRNYGIGCSMISQRPQSINTEVRNQCEPLIVFQLVAKHERDAVKGWMEHMGVNAELEELSKLKTGECFFWSPAWLEKFIRTRFKEKTSFDASSTPTATGRHKQPAKLKGPDLGKLQTAMAATIEEAKANDPAELRKQIADLKRQKTPAAATAPAGDVKRAVRGRDQWWQQKATALQVELKEQGRRLQRLGQELKKISEASTIAWRLAAEAPAVNGSTITPPPAPVGFVIDKSTTLRVHPGRVDYVPKHIGKLDPAKEFGDEMKLGKAERAILRAMYWLRDETVTAAKVGFYSDYSSNSGTFTNALGRLRSLGLVQGWQITDAGVAVTPDDVGDKPRGRELREWLRSKLGKAENALLDAMMAAHPSRLNDEQIAEGSGYSSNSGTFTNALGRLRTLEAAEGYAKQGGTKAADVFFE